MAVTQLLTKYVTRYCNEYNIPLPRESEVGAQNEYNIPIRINDILFSFWIGIKKNENVDYLYIRIPVMEIPVGKNLLPLYRKILEINYYLRGLSFSLKETTIFLSLFKHLGTKGIYNSFKYQDFKNSMNDLYSTLNKYAEYLYYEFESDGE